MAELLTRTRVLLHVGFQPGLCLLLMFAGIWICDNATLELLEPPGGSLLMRIISLAAYVVAFAFAITLARRKHDSGEVRIPTRKLASLVGCGCALFALGALGVFVGQSSTGTLLALVPLALTKCIGPFLSIAVLLMFASLQRRVITSAAALGMAGAFAVEQVVGVTALAAGWGNEVVFAAGAVCLAGASICVIATLLRTQETPAYAKPTTEPPAEDELDLKPLRSVLDWKLAAGIMVTVMMLGFLRAGGSVGTAPSILPAAVVLVAAALAAWRFPALDARELFRAAIVCTAAGFLLGPLLAPISPDAGQLLISIGATLFEIVVWIVSAFIVCSCSERFLAAAAARLLAVCGHLLGTLIAFAASAASAVIPQAQEAASLAIVFAYVIMLLYLFNDPFSRLSSTPNKTRNVTTNVEPTDAPLSEPNLLYWKLPCATLAAEHGLTSRETDILEQLTQGRDLAFMEEKFVLSRNTVKMHIKHVYTKLNVHSKQDVIDLVDAVRERG